MLVIPTDGLQIKHYGFTKRFKKYLIIMHTWKFMQVQEAPVWWIQSNVLE